MGRKRVKTASYDSPGSDLSSVIHKGDLEEIVERAVEKAVSSLKGEISVLKTVIMKQEQFIKERGSKIDQLQFDLNQMKIVNNDMEQYNRKLSLRIHGLNIADDKDVVDIVIGFLSEKLEIAIKKEDICAAHPVRSSGRRKNKAAGIVKMLRETDKINIIKNRRKLKGQGITIHEDLTKKNLGLLVRVRSSSLVDDAWFAGGAVWAKRHGRKFRVGLLQSIEEAAEEVEYRRPNDRARSAASQRTTRRHGLHLSSTPTSAVQPEISQTNGE